MNIKGLQKALLRELAHDFEGLCDILIAIAIKSYLNVNIIKLKSKIFIYLGRINGRDHENKGRQDQCLVYT